MHSTIKYTIILILILSGKYLISQDQLYSQINSNPSNINTALTGVFDGKYRLGIAYRNQWFRISQNSSFNIKDFYADTKFNIVGDNYLGLGISISEKNSGTADVSLGMAHLNLSYQQKLNYNKYSSRSQFLIFGTQTGIGKLYSDFNNYFFGIQFDKNSESLNTSTPNGEELVNSDPFLDINAGLLYFNSTKYNSFYIGASIYHINSSIYSLIEGSNDKLQRRYSALVGGEINFNKNLSLLPSLIINIQNKFATYRIGSSIRAYYSDSEYNYVRFGLWTKIINTQETLDFSDLTLSAIFNFNRIEIGCSYDLNIGYSSELSRGNGAFEFNCNYILGDTPKHYKIFCPRF
ncbi:MAG: PorP/SprF family type IX secretion system membrane protein [Saprospiraceae bacterium]